MGPTGLSQASTALVGRERECAEIEGLLENAVGGESGTDRTPQVYPGSYVEYVQKIGHEAPGIYA